MTANLVRCEPFGHLQFQRNRSTLSNKYHSELISLPAAISQAGVTTTICQANEPMTEAITTWKLQLMVSSSLRHHRHD